MAEEFGLSLVPGSGNQPWWKLDLSGVKSRWSLKFTGSSSFRLTQDDITEAVEATQGISGDGSIPLWLLRIGSADFDMVVMRKQDFMLMQEGDLQLIGSDAPPRKSDERRARSRVPVLMREDS